jgi:hypothetical protein
MRRSDRGFWLVLGVLTLSAAALRFYRLGSWSYSGDEAFTLGFSTSGFTWQDLRPLAFAMNHYLAIPILGATELAIRFFPALFGLAAVPILGLLVRRSYGATTALWTAGLVAVSPGLVGHSQFGRYYMQSFTLTAVVPLALLAWVRDRHRGWLALAVACFAAGWFMVPSSSFIAPGLVLWGWVARREVLGDARIAWLARHRVWVALVGLAGFLVAAWLAMQVRAVYMVGGLESGMRYATPAQVVLGSVSVLGLSVVALAATGMVLLPRDEVLTRPARWLPFCWLVGSAAAFAAAYPLLAIGATHVVSVLAVVYLYAGYAVTRIWEGSRDRRVAFAGIAAVLAPQSRELYSHYIDGNHLDYRGAAGVVERLHRQTPGVTYVLGHGNFVPYAQGLPVHEFILAPDSLKWVADTHRATPVRLVLSEHRRGLDVPEDDPLMGHVLGVCRLEARLVRPRLDYYVNAMRVYDCPARATPPGI